MAIPVLRIERLMSNIWEYQQRKKAIRKSIGKWYGNPEYKERIKSINKRLSFWMNTLRILKKKQKIMHDVRRAIRVYFHVEIRGNIKIGGRAEENKKERIARWIFCKYILENHKITSCRISHYLGSNDDEFASVSRWRLTTKFKADPSIYNDWRGFNNFIRNEYGKKSEPRKRGRPRKSQEWMPHR
jgi:hypothetical protein